MDVHHFVDALLRLLPTPDKVYYISLWVTSFCTWPILFFITWWFIYFGWESALDGNFRFFMRLSSCRKVKWCMSYVQLYIWYQRRVYTEPEIPVPERLPSHFRSLPLCRLNSLLLLTTQYTFSAERDHYIADSTRNNYVLLIVLSLIFFAVKKATFLVELRELVREEDHGEYDYR